MTGWTRRRRTWGKKKRIILPEQLISELQKCAQEIGKTPTIREFNEWAGCGRYAAVISKYGTWSKGLEAAGMVPTTRYPGRTKKYHEADFVAAYKLGKRQCTTGLPTPRWWHEQGFRPSAGTIENRYGSFRAFIEAMEEEIEREAAK